MTGASNPEHLSVAAFLSNLPELLGAMSVDPRCMVAIAEFEDGRYVQFWVDSDGSVLSEVISNVYLRDGRALNDAQEDALRDDGWRGPERGSSPNWHVEAHDVSTLITSVHMVRRAVLDVLGEAPSNVVSIVTWEVRRPAGASAQDQREMSRVRVRELFEAWERDVDD